MSGLLCCFKDEEGRCFSDSLTELSVLQGGGSKYVFQTFIHVFKNLAL